MLREGKLKAAVLPEPVVSLAVASGAVPLADEQDQSGFVCSVLAFSRDAVERAPDAVRGYCAAMDRAGEAINADPKGARALAVSEKLLPGPLAESFVMPIFPVGSVCAEPVYASAAAWLKGTGRLAESAAYEDVIWSGRSGND